MNSNSENHGDKGFLLQLSMRTQQVANEVKELLHERQRIDVRIKRAKDYFEKLNTFLTSEGQKPISISLVPQTGNPVGKPGNRSKEFPIRKIAWDGMSINQIIKHILGSSPNVSFNPKSVTKEIYEIQSDSDLRLVIRNIRSYLQRGDRDGLWEKTGRAMFRAKVTEQQGALVNT